MNIFVVNSCPLLAAQQLPDRYTVKMPVESCQLLAATFQKIGGFSSLFIKKDGTPYKVTSSLLANPLVIWLSKDPQHIFWLLFHAKELAKEYTLRYNKIHACEKIINDVLVAFQSQHRADYTQLKESDAFVTLVPATILTRSQGLSVARTYQMYLRTKSWIGSNYQRCPERKPLWLKGIE